MKKQSQFSKILNIKSIELFKNGIRIDLCKKKSVLIIEWKNYSILKEIFISKMGRKKRPPC